jgi:hypothetical protein
VANLTGKGDADLALVNMHGRMYDGAGLEPQTETEEGLTSLAASAVSGRSPPAGPEWRCKSLPLPPLVRSPPLR